MRKMAGNSKTKPNVKGHYFGFEEIFRDLVVIPAPICVTSIGRYSVKKLCSKFQLAMILH